MRESKKNIVFLTSHVPTNLQNLKALAQVEVFYGKPNRWETHQQHELSLCKHIKVLNECYVIKPQTDIYEYEQQFEITSECLQRLQQMNRLITV